MSTFVPFRSGSFLLALTTVFVLAVWSAVALEPAGPWVALLENLHWTVSFGMSAWVAWRASKDAQVQAETRCIRAWFARAMIILAVGQVLWDIQVYAGWNPFPAPSDVLFLALGPLFMVGFYRALKSGTNSVRLRLVILDVGGIALAALALALTLYLPLGAQSTGLQLAVFTAYPVMLITAAATAFVMQLHLRQRWTVRWNALFLGLCGHGVLWMAWNLATLDNTIASGTLMTLLFSLFTLLLGWGASGWQLSPEPSARFDRLCEGFLRQLPLITVALTSAAIGLLVLGGGIPEIARAPLLAIGASVLVLAVIRQTQQLGERDRLQDAEREVAALLKVQETQNAQLQLANASLELRVAERTQKLEDALTILHHTQSEMVQSEKLASLGRVVAGVAHELNTPLGNAMMVASTILELQEELRREHAAGALKRSTLENLLQRTHDGMDVLFRNVERAASIVRDFKQVAVDQTSDQRRIFDVAQVLGETLSLIQPAVRSAHCQVDLQVAPHMACNSYPGAFGQVVSNLVMNAVLHGYAGRPTGQVLITAQPHDTNHFKLQVIDNGNGMEEGVLSRVYDPFFTTKMGRGGTGLGMNIVQSLVMRVLGGTVGVTSRVGQGTTVTVIVPLEAPTLAR